MKRLLAVLLMALLLTGCGQGEGPEPETSKGETTVNEPVSDTETKQEPEQETISEEKSDTEPEPEVEPEPSPAPKPEAEPSMEPESAAELEPKPEMDWAALTAKAYLTITDQKQFAVRVEEQNGTTTDLSIRRGENDWNVEGTENSFAGYTWKAADLDDWLAQESAEDRDTKLTLGTPGTLSLTCCEGGDVVEVVNGGTVTYVWAVNPKEGQEPFEGKLYALLDMIAEDAMSEQVWSVTVSATLSADEAAGQLTENIAEAYRSLPDWVSWKPMDVQAVSSEVYDVYRGTPEQFCFYLGVEVKLEDPAAPEAMYWQAGSGLGEPNEDGFYGWGREVLVEKTANGFWVPVDWGTGGYSVEPRFDESKDALEQLVEVFCLTEGFTHDWITPNHILDLPEEEMVKLPGILDQLTDAEVHDLCGALEKCLRENDYWEWTIDTLKPVLGDYGALLDE